MVREASFPECGEPLVEGGTRGFEVPELRAVFSQEGSFRGVGCGYCGYGGGAASSVFQDDGPLFDGESYGDGGGVDVPSEGDGGLFEIGS